ncbi:hypothetical protein HanPSC8_Chr01g0003511 [Helianthus annuus]|nr:hypothetical protein HanPSC8_Chr01g0003511 [Helianthus annuus]
MSEPKIVMLTCHSLLEDQLAESSVRNCLTRVVSNSRQPSWRRQVFGQSSYSRGESYSHLS